MLNAYGVANMTNEQIRNQLNLLRERWRNTTDPDEREKILSEATELKSQLTPEDARPKTPTLREMQERVLSWKSVPDERVSYMTKLLNETKN